MTAGAAGELYVLSAGAAQGLVAALAPRLLAAEDVTLRTTFGAVGAIREKLLAGDRCDVLILTESMIDQLTASGHVVANSGAALGHVRTGIGVRSDDPPPDISDRQALEQSLRNATDIFLPDPSVDGGVHFAR
jgi:molybdate transport system substrate-binding protein